MAIRIGRLSLPNPILTAAGTSGHGAELSSYMDLASLGAVVVKSLSADPWAGNPSPRVVALPSGMLNSVGLQNRGVEAWIAEELPPLAATGARVVVSLWGFSVADYARAARLLASAVGRGLGGTQQIVAVELNVSCPNVEDRRSMFGHSPEATASVVGAAREELAEVGLPAWAKLSPNVTDLVGIAAAALGAGADGLTLVNTLMGLALDPATRQPRLGAGGGGLSGPAIHAVAVRAVYEVSAAHPGVPIIGVGGVSSGVEAAELMVAGASAVQIGTATFADPRAPSKVLAELEEWCHLHGVADIVELVGSAHECPR